MPPKFRRQLEYQTNRTRKEIPQRNSTPREKLQVTDKAKPFRIAPHVSWEIPKARRSWKNIFRALEDNACYPRLLYIKKLSFVIESERKTIHGKHKLKKFMTAESALQKLLKESYVWKRKINNIRGATEKNEQQWGIWRDGSVVKTIYGMLFTQAFLYCFYRRCKFGSSIHMEGS